MKQLKEKESESTLAESVFLSDFLLASDVRKTRKLEDKFG